MIQNKKVKGLQLSSAVFQLETKYTRVSFEDYSKLTALIQQHLECEFDEDKVLRCENSQDLLNFSFKIKLGLTNVY